jgi:glycosyltransferase involved in cell wall biosynthesis
MPGAAATPGRSVLIVEERAHHATGHYPVRFAQLAEAYAELGFHVEVLTERGWAHRAADPPFTVHQFGWTARASQRIAARLGAHARTGQLLRRRVEKLVLHAAMIGAIRARRGRMEPRPDATVILGPSIEPWFVALGVGPGRWLVNEFFAPPARPDEGPGVITDMAVLLAARSERRRRSGNGRLRIATATELWAAQWAEWARFLDPIVLPIAGARTLERSEHARTRLGLPAHGRIALFFGADQSKDPATVLEAFRHLDGWTLVIAGQISDTVEVPLSGDVLLRGGHLSDERRDLLLSAADLMVFSFVRDYRRDSGTLMDAISVGVPVVCSGESAAAEIVRRYRLGNVFEPGDSASLAEAVRDAPASIAPADLARARADCSNLAVARGQLQALGIDAPSAAATAI